MTVLLKFLPQHNKSPFIFHPPTTSVFHVITALTSKNLSEALLDFMKTLKLLLDLTNIVICIININDLSVYTRCPVPKPISYVSSFYNRIIRGTKCML